MKDGTGQYRMSRALVHRVRQNHEIHRRAQARFNKLGVSERDVLEEALRMGLEVADGVR